VIEEEEFTMENSQPLEPNEEASKEVKDEVEERKPMPFGILGIMFLVGLTQFAAFIGLTVLVVAIIIIFGPK
jgi:hypothetical protein